MLHAVKYLLIAMQFPQVHKKNFMMMMLNFLCLTSASTAFAVDSEADAKTWIELSNREECFDHHFTVFFIIKANAFPSNSNPLLLLTLKIYNLQLNFKPLKVLRNPFQHKSIGNFKMIQFLSSREFFDDEVNI